jgi:hypothetical protein
MITSVRLTFNKLSNIQSSLIEDAILAIDSKLVQYSFSANLTLFFIILTFMLILFYLAFIIQKIVVLMRTQ